MAGIFLHVFPFTLCSLFFLTVDCSFMVSFSSPSFFKYLKEDIVHFMC